MKNVCAMLYEPDGMMLQEEYSESEIQPELFMNFRFEGKTNFHIQRANLTEYCD